MQCDGTNHPPRSNIMAYLIRTLYQHSFASTEEQAHEIAHQYLADMVRNQLPDTHTWAKVINCDSQAVQTITPVMPTAHTYTHEPSGQVITFYHTQIMTI